VFLHSEPPIYRNQRMAEYKPVQAVKIFLLFFILERKCEVPTFKGKRLIPLVYFLVYKLRKGCTVVPEAIIIESLFINFICCQHAGLYHFFFKQHIFSFSPIALSLNIRNFLRNAPPWPEQRPVSSNNSPNSAE